jgi:hydroxymethylpyrimidine pyrophosphatase-like HAD family hydrolase
MGEIRLVASDLDGTLLRPDETVSERTRHAIAAAQQAGITVVLVTGRPPRSLAPIAARIGLGGIAICANGAVVWDLDAGAMVDTSPLAAEAAAALIRGLREALPFAELARRARETVGEEAVVTWAGTRVVEISAAGVTKARALERLCARLGVQREEVVAVGDMENDLAMLAWAGHAVAVANAQQDVLDAADEVTASNLDDGVAQVLERLVADRAARS